MILLDTNIISELISAASATEVLQWAETIPADSLYLSAITIAEMRFGVEMMDRGKRRNGIEQSINALIENDYKGRILPFDHLAGDVYGALVARLKRQGMNIDQNDAMIAAIALRYDIPVATRNVKHFAPCGVNVINPFELQ